MATKLVVIIFDKIADAQNALNDLKQIEHDGQIEIDDFAIITKETDGRVSVHNTTPSGAKKGAVAGGVLGLILAGIFFPVAGIAIGAGAGAMIGKGLQLGIDKEFVNEVILKLEPGTSALFLTGERGSPEAALRVMERYKGTVYHTNLDEEVEEELRKALKSSEGT
jgi:uncharacterized membrane protein